ncbi:putative membrane protein [Mycobacterium avium subsp. avium 2285 (R)]|nr:putative membrane protein [Mycobacterium avium subsp. avium 2285 (R)]
MAALSAVVFTLSAWLGLYLAARDPRKPVLVLAAIGLCGFALVVGLDAVRTASPAHAPLLSRVEIYLTAVPGVAWFAVLVELSRPPDGWRSRTREVLLVAGVAALTLLGAALAGSVDGPLRPGHWLMMAAISVSTLGAMAVALRRPRRPRPAVGLAVTATLFFALANAILIIPLGLVPSWLALASTSCDVLGLGVAVALWDAFDEGHALRADMLRSFAGSVAVAVLFGGQALIGLAVTRTDPGARTALTVLLFTSLAIAITVQVLADPLAGLLDRLAFSKSPALRADRAALRHTGAALPLRQEHPLDGVDDVTFARLTRRALGHYGDLTKLVASPLTALPVIDERLAARGAPTSRSSGPPSSRPCWPTPSPGSSRATAATSGPPRSGATTTRCISPTSSGCAPTPRTPPRRAWIRRLGRPGSGSSPRFPSARCTTGRTPPPG